MTPPFRADQVGSLLRPAALRKAFRQHREGTLSEAEYRRVTDDAVRDVVRLQESVGLQSITDGEFRRASYWAHFVEAVDGLTIGPALFEFKDADGERLAFTAPHTVGKLSRTHPAGHQHYTAVARWFEVAETAVCSATRPSRAVSPGPPMRNTCS